MTNQKTEEAQQALREMANAPEFPSPTSKAQEAFDAWFLAHKKGEATSDEFRLFLEAPGGASDLYATHGKILEIGFRAGYNAAAKALHDKIYWSDEIDPLGITPGKDKVLAGYLREAVLMSRIFGFMTRHGSMPSRSELIFDQHMLAEFGDAYRKAIDQAILQCDSVANSVRAFINAAESQCASGAPKAEPKIEPEVAAVTSENAFSHNGVEYKAEPATHGCHGCALCDGSSSADCQVPENGLSCFGVTRADKKSIIWVVKS